MADITALLTDSMSNLSFPNNQQTEGSIFELFPQLPTELRLKIWHHTLPASTILRLTATILVSDPDFGLYMTFFTSEHDGGLARYHFSTGHRGLSESRSIPLLRACKESRELYLDNFTISLPFGGRGEGRLYVSKKEILHLSNYSDLLHDGAVQRALNNNYRLQNWWEEIEKLAIDITSLLVSGKYWALIPSLVKKMPALKDLKGVMWEGFQDINEEGSKTIKDAMNAQLRNAERELSRCLDEEENKFAVPEISLMI